MKVRGRIGDRFYLSEGHDVHRRRGQESPTPPPSKEVLERTLNELADAGYVEFFVDDAGENTWELTFSGERLKKILGHFDN